MKANRDIDKLSNNFRLKVIDFLNEVGDKIFITEGFRSDERQKELYAQGRTKPGNKVTWVKHSNHQDGLAIDIAFRGTELYPKNIDRWKEIGSIAKKYGIDWGFNLWGVDKPHFQDNGKPYIINKDIMKQYGDDVTTNGLTYPGTIYGVDVRLTDESFDRTGLLKLHGVNTHKETYILLHPHTVRKGENKVKEVLSHEFAHIIYHTILKSNIFEKIDNTDMKLTKYEYWDFISRNITQYITEYASTHSAEDFAECIGYGHYIENKLHLPKKAKWNNITRTKYIIANNLYKHGLAKYLKS